MLAPGASEEVGRVFDGMDDGGTVVVPEPGVAGGRKFEFGSTVMGIKKQEKNKRKREKISQKI